MYMHLLPFKRKRTNTNVSTTQAHRRSREAKRRKHIVAGCYLSTKPYIQNIYHAYVYAVYAVFIQTQYTLNTMHTFAGTL